MTASQVLELPLDDALLKVLSSESRREILRLLAERRMTGAEMANRLNLGKPAVSEHLKRLTEAGLIERADDPERRWVYYNLSSRGRSILEPQRVRFYLVMAVATLALVLGMVLALGFTLFLTQGGAAGGIAADPAESGQTYVGAEAYRPPVRTAPVATAPAASATTEDAVVPEPKVAAVTVVTVPHRICPVGKTCTPEAASGEETVETPAAFVLVLPDGQVAPPPATSVVYAFQESDIDAALNTITVHPIDAAAVDEVADDLGVPDADLTTLASMAGAITLTSGGTLLPVADDVEIPVVQFDAEEQREAFSLTQALRIDVPAGVTFSEPLEDETELLALDGLDVAPSAPESPATADVATRDSAAPPAGESVPQTPAAAPADDAGAAPVAGDAAAPADGTQGTGAPATEPAADAVREPVSGAQDDGAASGVDAAAPVAGPMPFVAPAQGREPADSAVLPFVAIFAAAALVGLIRRRSA